MTDRELLEQVEDVVVSVYGVGGGFFRSVPLPEGAKIEDVKATVTDGGVGGRHENQRDHDGATEDGLAQHHAGRGGATAVGC